MAHPAEDFQGTGMPNRKLSQEAVVPKKLLLSET